MMVEGLRSLSWVESRAPMPRPSLALVFIGFRGVNRYKIHPWMSLYISLPFKENKSNAPMKIVKYHEHNKTTYKSR